MPNSSSAVHGNVMWVKGTCPFTHLLTVQMHLCLVVWLVSLRTTQLYISYDFLSGGVTALTRKVAQGKSISWTASLPWSNWYHHTNKWMPGSFAMKQCHIFFYDPVALSSHRDWESSPTESLFSTFSTRQCRSTKPPCIHDTLPPHGVCRRGPWANSCEPKLTALAGECS